MKPNLMGLMRWALIGLLPFALLACRTPSEKQAAAAKKVAAVEQRLETNRIAQARTGAGLADAALYALGKDPAPNLFADTAKLTLGRSMLAFQGADMTAGAQEVLFLRGMVDGLLATNAALRADGQKALALVDGRLARSEATANGLEAKLAMAEAKLDQVNALNAGLADSWATLRRWIRWGLFGLLAVVVVRIAGSVLPPPYNSVLFIVDYVVGGVARMAFSVLPQAKAAARVVAQDANDLAVGTATRMVAAIEAVKTKSPEVFEATVAPELRDQTDKDTHREYIRSLKPKS